MLNRSQSMCLSFMMLAVPGIYAAVAQQSAPSSNHALSSTKREEIKFMIGQVQQMQPDCVGTSPIATSYRPSERNGEINLTELHGGVPLIDTYAQYPSWFWRSFSIALGLSVATIAGGLYIKFTPEQVATFAKYVSFGSIGWGVCSQLYRSATWDTYYSPDLVSNIREQERELRMSRGDQLWQLSDTLKRAKENGMIGSAEEHHNNEQLPAALHKIMTDTEAPYLTTLCNRVQANVKLRNYDSTLGYLTAGFAGLILAQSLKGLAQK